MVTSVTVLGAWGRVEFVYVIPVVPGTGTTLVGREDVMDPVVTSEVAPGISVVPGTGDTSEEEEQGNEIVSVVSSVAVPGIAEVVWPSAVVAETGATLVALGRDEEIDSVAVAVTVEDSALVTELLPVDTSVVLGTGV